MTAAPLWTAAEAAAATGGRAVGDWTATGVEIDSRAVAPGDLFVALEGGARDGHGFVADALAEGAAAALVRRVPEGVAADGPLLIVEDTLAALGALGATARARLAPAARVIGVTGSVGKTGTKEMLREMLAPQGRTHAAAKSFNNHIGVPLTLARMPSDTDFAVIEMGMNHAGEIGPLSRLSRPHVALITTVEAVHIEFFDSEEGIADAKAEIFEGVAPGGVAVLNADNRHFTRLRAAAEARGLAVTSFGRAGDARLVSADLREGVTVARAEIGGAALAFKIAAPGRHLAANATGALACVAAAGGDLAQATMGLATWRAPAGRGARWIVALGAHGVDGEITLIDESYNANPASVGAALEALEATPVRDGIGRIARGRRIAVLGDMLELGDAATAMHAGLAAHPALAAVDCVMTVGPLMRALHAALPADKRGEWFADAASAAKRLRRVVDAGDVIMVKGSLGTGMAPVVDALKAAGAARLAAGGEEP
jgi:UDP-N-acetylmuramoyl-tripeptide--D-alanyl-D-alanine ligase